MSKRGLIRTWPTAVVGLLIAVLVSSQFGYTQEERLPGEGFSANPELKGGQDLFGPYEVVENWPRPMAESLPGHEGWSYSMTLDVFAESPDRVFLIQRGELPVIENRPEPVWLPELGPSMQYPVRGLPLRNAGDSAPNSAPNKLQRDDEGVGRPGWQWEHQDEGVDRPGIDWRWEHLVLVVDSKGHIVEEWSQWDELIVQPHSIDISPYDADKHVWIVDAEGRAVYKFTNDGKELVLTLGTPGESGNDDSHLAHPTYLAFMDENTMYLPDGHDNTRVIKYDMDGNILGQWGKKGKPTGELRPGYFSMIHGIAVDPTTRRVYVNDAKNNRLQVFDEDGNYLDEWSFGPALAEGIPGVLTILVGSNRKLWASDYATHKILGYDLEGHFLYSWGTFGNFPGALWGVHGMSTDQEGNFYTASMNNGRIQKFRPRQGVNPEFLVGKPWRGVW